MGVGGRKESGEGSCGRDGKGSGWRRDRRGRVMGREDGGGGTGIVDGGSGGGMGRQGREEEGWEEGVSEQEGW